ncbi:MAG TPA: UvrD-helicase domain-containing protein [Tepidisphaeraceae bacterium]|jgi:DNA helicase-2/ATP-dependent DNA helicase PcrA|nr:UvrD-helicase domain-containing protein [Tepidisphaeraceae bacterium]
MSLNLEQKEVAEHLSGRILTLAGPGSGKTRTLTERTGRLIQKGIPAGKILCLTFTNKARDEMRERIARAHGAAAQQVFISNFHGLCGTILRKLGEPFGYDWRMTICDSDDQIDLLMQIARKKGMEPTKPQGRAMAMAVNDWRENLGTESALDAMVEDKRISDRELPIIREYLRTLRGRNMVDFSGLLSETAKLLRDHPDVRGKLQLKFQFIQVDEYQDTNRAQNEIVELMAGEEDNVLAVGDVDQSIYGWRGASPDAIPRFIENGKRKRGTCKVVKLGTNYRSTPEVIAVADRLIRHSAERIAVDFKAIHPSGEEVKCAKLGTPEEEGEAVAMSVSNTMKSGVQPRDMAIFYRTNDMSRLVEQGLAKRQIPYVVIGGGSYYDRMEVRDVLSMLRFMVNPKDGISFARVANKPARGMGDALIGRIEAFAETHNLDLMQVISEEQLPRIRDEHGKPLADAALRACRVVRDIFDIPFQQMRLGDVVNEVLDRTHYDQWLKDKYEEKNEYDQRRQNVNELVNAITTFGRTNQKATLADYLQSIALYTETDKADKDGNAVKLMSLHASKGLEFDVVYMIGVEEGVLPHYKAVEIGVVEEERRLCYVGFTRAKKVLRVTWCEKRQDTSSRGGGAKFRVSMPSRFLMEAGLIAEGEYKIVAAEKKEKRARAEGRSISGWKQD